MKAKIIQIGNSKGLRLSKTILEKYQIKDRVELVLEENQIILRPISSIRADWDNAFSSASSHKDHENLIDDVFEDEDFDEWK